MKKKFIFSLYAILLGALSVSLVSCGSNSKGHELTTDEDIVKYSIENLLHDISVQKTEQFQWLSKDILIKMYGSEENALKQGADLAQGVINEPDVWKDITTKAMKDFNDRGKEVGIDWNTAKIDSIIFERQEDEFNAQCYDGEAILACGNQKYTMSFKNLLFYEGEPRYLDGIEFAPYEDAESYTLNQEGSFEDFYLSLATCYSKGLEKEVDKIVLIDKNGLKVIADETMIPSNFIDSYRETFLPSVKNHNYISEKLPYELIEKFGIADNSGLDKNEMKKSEICEVAGGDEGVGVLCGFFYTYKGKWYLWHMY